MWWENIYIIYVAWVRNRWPKLLNTNVISTSIKVGQFLEYVSNCQLMRKDFDP
jgi:hypothetical protein